MTGEYLDHLIDRTTGENYAVTIRGVDHQIGIQIQGFSDKTSDDHDGVPVLLDLSDGKLQLLVWADINQEDPTHIIDLEGARIEKREDDEEEINNA